METTDQEEAERLYEQNVQLMVQLIVDHVLRLGLFGEVPAPCGKSTPNPSRQTRTAQPLRCRARGSGEEH